MNFKKFISGVSALTIAASAFAGMAVTANAAVEATAENLQESVDYTTGSWTAGDKDSWVDAKTYPNGLPTVGWVENATKSYMQITATGYGNYDRNFSVSKALRSTYSHQVKLVADLKWNGNTGNKNASSPAIALTDANKANIIKIAADGQDGEIYVNGTAVTNEWGASGSNSAVRGGTWNIVFDIDFDEATVSYAITNAYNSQTYTNSTSTSSINLSGITISSGDHGHSTPGAYVYGYKVYQVAQQEASYTINYNLANGTNVDSAVVNDFANAKPVISHGTVKLQDGYYYNYVSDDLTNDTVIAADNSTEVNVVVEKTVATLYSSINGSTEVVGQANAQDSNVSIYYPRYAVKDNTVYLAEPHDDSSKRYSYTISVANGNANATVTYGATDTEGDVVYFNEAENIEGLTATSKDAIRMSNGAAGYATVNTKIVKLPAGVYKIYSATRFTGNSANAATFTFKAGENDILSMTSTGSWANRSASFTLSDETDIYLGAAGSENSGVDYVLITKTGDYIAPTTFDKAISDVRTFSTAATNNNYDIDATVGTLQITPSADVEGLKLWYEGVYKQFSGHVGSNSPVSVIVIVNGIHNNLSADAFDVTTID